MTQAVTWGCPTVGPATPTVLTQRIDDSFDALLSGHSGPARPGYAVAGTIWEDTSIGGETRIYFYDGAQDILVAVIDTANDRVELAPQPLVDVASAATADIGAVKSRNIRITGTATITSFGNIRAGTTKTVYFAAALAVTYNATSLITPSGASLAVAAGDSIELVSLGSGNWRVISHRRDGASMALQTVSSFTGAVATGTALIPNDDTIPQITEGTEFLTVTITPKSAGSILEIDTQLAMSLSAGSYRAMALFQNGVADALKAVLPPPGSASYVDAPMIKHRMVAGTTSAINFSVRAGPSTAATMTINGAAGARQLGGVMNSYIIVKEYTP